MVLRRGLADVRSRSGLRVEPLDPRETSRLLMLSLVHFCHPVLVAQYLQDKQDLEGDARASVHFLLRAITPRS